MSQKYESYKYGYYQNLVSFFEESLLGIEGQELLQLTDHGALQ